MHHHQRLQGLYILTDKNLTPPEDLLQAVEQAIAGGCRIVQYRDKDSNKTSRAQQATELKTLCQRSNTLLIINDDVALARQVNADGVHLGKHDASLQQAREQLGESAIIGVSCYNNIELALKAEKAGADYVAFGSFFQSDIKPEAVRAEIDLLHSAKKQLDIPVVAIGGINQHNAADLISAGADMLAVISAVFAQTDIQASSRQLSDLFTIK